MSRVNWHGCYDKFEWRAQDRKFYYIVIISNTGRVVWSVVLVNLCQNRWRGFDRTQFKHSVQTLSSSTPQLLMADSQARFVIQNPRARSSRWTINLVCMTGWGGSSRDHGSVLTQHSVGISQCIQDVHYRNVSRNVHGLFITDCCVIGEIGIHLRANKCVHACDHERLSPLILPYDEVSSSFRIRSLHRRSLF